MDKRIRADARELGRGDCVDQLAHGKEDSFYSNCDGKLLEPKEQYSLIIFPIIKFSMENRPKGPNRKQEYPLGRYWNSSTKDHDLDCSGFHEDGKKWFDLGYFLNMRFVNGLDAPCVIAVGILEIYYYNTKTHCTLEKTFSKIIHS